MMVTELKREMGCSRSVISLHDKMKATIENLADEESRRLLEEG